MDNPDKLKVANFTQCGDETVLTLKYGIGILYSLWEEASDLQQIGSKRYVEAGV